MNNITKRTRTIEITEYIIECECGRKIIGSTESQVIFLLGVHKKGKRCKHEK